MHHCYLLRYHLCSQHRCKHTQTLAVCIQLIADAFMLLVLEVLVLIATISYIATCCTALISELELTLLLLLAIPIKIIVQSKRNTITFEICTGSKKEGFLSGRCTKYLLPPFTYCQQQK
ncbi:uncharacterized protein isoform X2 [Rhodnius prolixus]|uniref:uncharacterized protein isoform X2 n=1 Tax=Rhodnius prolixus TaxID=13249 RepID=UPI003D18B47C